MRYLLVVIEDFGLRRIVLEQLSDSADFILAIDETTVVANWSNCNGLVTDSWDRVTRFVGERGCDPLHNDPFAVLLTEDAGLRTRATMRNIRSFFPRTEWRNFLFATRAFLHPAPVPA